MAVKIVAIGAPSDDRQVPYDFGPDPTQLMDICISIHLAPGCALVTKFGQTYVPLLAIGDTHELYVKIRQPRASKCIESSKLRPGSSLALCTEIESMLGNVLTDLVTIQASYTHPRLPDDNVVSVEHTCRVHRTTNHGLSSLNARTDLHEHQIAVRQSLLAWLSRNAYVEGISTTQPIRLSSRVQSQRSCSHKDDRAMPAGLQIVKRKSPGRDLTQGRLRHVMPQAKSISDKPVRSVSEHDCRAVKSSCNDGRTAWQAVRRSVTSDLSGQRHSAHGNKYAA